MFDIFTSVSPQTYATYTNGWLLSIKDQLLNNADNIKAWYRGSNLMLPNQHLLVRIIGSLPTRLPNTEPLDYVDGVNQEFRAIANSWGLTSSINVGKVHTDGTFYNKSCSEILIWDDSDFDVPNWEMMSPVKIMSNPYTDMSFGIPNGHYPAIETGTAVIAINVGMLMLQYSYWLMQQIQLHGADIPNIGNFVQSYPLANAVDSHIEVCFLNRIIATHYKQPLAHFHRLYSFPVLNYEHNIDSVIKTYFSMAKMRNGAIGQLKNLPSVIDPSMEEAMQVPDMAITGPCKWAFYLSRARLMSFLIDRVGGVGSSDPAEIQTLWMALKLMFNYNTFGAISDEVLLPLTNLYTKTSEIVGQ